MPQSHFSFSSLFFTITWPALRIKQQLLFLQLIFSCSRDGTLFPQCSVPANNLWHPTPSHPLTKPAQFPRYASLLKAALTEGVHRAIGAKRQQHSGGQVQKTSSLWAVHVHRPLSLSFIVIIFITTIIDRAFVYPSVIIFHCECLGY